MIPATTTTAERRRRAPGHGWTLACALAALAAWNAAIPDVAAARPPAPRVVNITQLELFRAAPGGRVEIVLDRAVAPESFQASPDRLVFELDNTRPGYGVYGRLFDDVLVAELRIANVGLPSRPRTRIEIALRAPVTHRIRAAGQRIVIDLVPDGAELPPIASPQIAAPRPVARPAPIAPPRPAEPPPPPAVEEVGEIAEVLPDEMPPPEAPVVEERVEEMTTPLAGITEEFLDEPPPATVELPDVVTAAPEAIVEGVPDELPPPMKPAPEAIAEVAEILPDELPPAEAPAIEESVEEAAAPPAAMTEEILDELPPTTPELPDVVTAAPEAIVEGVPDELPPPIEPAPEAIAEVAEILPDEMPPAAAPAIEQIVEEAVAPPAAITEEFLDELPPAPEETPAVADAAPEATAEILPDEMPPAAVSPSEAIAEILPDEMPPPEPPITQETAVPTTETPAARLIPVEPLAGAAPALPLPSPAAPPATPDEPAVAEPVAPPVAPPVDLPVSPPAPVGPATRVTAIELLAPGVVRIAADGELDYLTFRLENPERFVIELDGVVNLSPLDSLPVQEPLLLRVRVGQYRSAPRPVTRVVFDLRAPSIPEIESTPAGLVVRFVRAVPRVAADARPSVTSGVFASR